MADIYRDIRVVGGYLPYNECFRSIASSGAKPKQEGRQYVIARGVRARCRRKVS